MFLEDITDFIIISVLFTFINISINALFKRKNADTKLQQISPKKKSSSRFKKRCGKNTTATSQVVHRTPTKKKNKGLEYPRKWRPQWAEVPGFRNWVHLDLNDLNHVRCKICNGKPLRATTTTLKKHASSEIHKRNCQRQGVDLIKEFKMPERVLWDQKMAIAELKFAAIHATFNYSYKNSNLLALMLKNLDPTSIFAYLKVGATKITMLVVKVIAKAAKEELATILQQSNFSVCLDESTDSGKEKVLVINVRYFDPKCHQICTKMWALPKVFIQGEKANAGSKRLCTLLIESFTEHKINILNIISVCSDGCSAMVGETSGLKALMIKQIPHVKWVTCPAHKTHLCAKNAMDILPKYLLELIINFHTMLKTSHRKQNFSVLQQQLNLPVHKIPRFISVRWLSLEICVNRALEQWQALFIFSKILAKQNDCIGKKVYKAMKLPDTKLYFYLIQHTVRQLNLLNKYFQCDDVIIDKCAEQIEKTYKKLLCCIIHSLAVNPFAIDEVRPFEEEQYLSFEDLQFGEHLNFYINKHGEKMKSFLERAFKFVSVLCMEIEIRFDNFNDELFTAFKCMNPQNALSEDFHMKNGHLFEKWLYNFSFLINPEKFEEVQKQWDILCTMNIVAPAMPADQFWYLVLNLTDEQGNYLFTELANTAIISLTVPHANASSERKFSDMNLLKTKIKTCFKTETVEATLRAKQYIKSFSLQAGGFEPSERMIELCLARKYYNRKPSKKASLIEQMF